MTDSPLPIAQTTDIAQFATGGVAFSEEELQELKLVFLTTVESTRRQEVFRRLLLSQLPLETKAQISFHLLKDSQVTLQTEALRALQGLGQDFKLIENLLEVLDQQPERIQKACQVLENLELTEDVGPWVFSFLLQRFGSCNDLGTLKDLSKVLRTHNRFLESNQLALLVGYVLSRPQQVYKATRSILFGWATTPEQGKLLFDEFSRHEVSIVGEWLLPLAIKAKYCEDEVIEALARQFHLQTDLMDSSVLAQHLIAFGDLALEGLINDFDDSLRPSEALLVISKILELQKSSDEILKRVFEFSLSLFRSERRELIPALLGMPFDRLSLDPQIHRQWLREIFLAREQVSSDYLQNEIDFRIRQTGSLSLEVLLEMVLYGTQEPHRLQALELYVQMLPDQEEPLEKASKLLSDLSQTKDLNLGDVLKAYRILWSYPSYPQLRREQEVKEFLGALWRKSRTLERLEALSGALPLISPPLATQIVLAVLDLLEYKLPQIEKRSSQQQVDLLSSALLEQSYLVAGLRNAQVAFCRQDLLSELMEKLAKFLLNHWKGVKIGEVSWGPDGTRHLIRSLVSLAKHQENWRRQAIGELIEELGFLEVQKGLVLLWSHLDDKELRLIANWLVDRLQEPRGLEPEEFESLLDLSRVYLEQYPQSVEDQAIRLLNRLQGLHRFASNQITPFLKNLKLNNTKLQSFIGS